MARPKSGKTAKVILDLIQVKKLAGMNCTLEEMAAFFDCDVSTLTRNYAEALTKGREIGKVSVRRMMWEQGQKGNSTALKYLVHNVLKEKIEDYSSRINEHTGSSEILEKLSHISTEAILRIVKDNEEKGA
jgi:hypothetical protein